ncbi:BZ3500_MvSof-1268-A1-R1_Chr8-1g09870 [Microbotryum saponariae]|uniref:BZ3500_MvSof-1268-A1-R1_Chr8-1g09870 protein n=1 Tax=Microbotryum saponariae TaxID=289078 RepID=A0A2X0KPS5_9BASI|nr:BZ3500_MvSof-1268-A1-R1_Chr8-1g09870 [Microbotryum saponariae]SDA08156.1 BZ3501_MvSof-1269-A2-R1_Chr8-1g09593 [Microbotryum saponariae]
MDDSMEALLAFLGLEPKNDRRLLLVPLVIEESPSPPSIDVSDASEWIDRERPIELSDVELIEGEEDGARMRLREEPTESAVSVGAPSCEFVFLRPKPKMPLLRFEMEPVDELIEPVEKRREGEMLDVADELDIIDAERAIPGGAKPGGERYLDLASGLRSSWYIGAMRSTISSKSSYSRSVPSSSSSSIASCRTSRGELAELTLLSLRARVGNVMRGGGGLLTSEAESVESSSLAPSPAVALCNALAAS